MALTKRQIGQLQKIVDTVQALIADADGAEPQRGKGNGARNVRTRRSGKELVAFRKMLRAERKKGVPVAEIAQRHKVSKAYVYQL